MNDQEPRYSFNVAFYGAPTTTGPRVSFPHVALAPALKGRMPRPDCVIYRDKPLPREVFWRTVEQGPPVWLPPRSAPPENVWVSMTPAPCPPLFHYHQSRLHRPGSLWPRFWF